VAIINSLRGFDFAGLNLDIEPDQIYKQPLTQAQFDNWMETLRSAAKAAPWPTAATMHPRYFRDPPYMSWNVEQRLRDAGIGQVVLMIFNSNPQRVADIARPIVGSPPRQRPALPRGAERRARTEPQLSYARRSPQDFRQSMQQLQGLLAAQPNTDGIVVQAGTICKGWVMKVRFVKPEASDPNRDRGVEVPYAPGKRHLARWRWYLILLVVSSPFLFFVASSSTRRC